MQSTFIQRSLSQNEISFSIRSHRVWSSHEILNITWLHGFAFMLRFYITLLSQCAKKILRHNSFGCNCVTHKNMKIFWMVYLIIFKYIEQNICISIIFLSGKKYRCHNEILFHNKKLVYQKMKYFHILRNTMISLSDFYPILC